MKLILPQALRVQVIKRYLSIKKENILLKERNNKLEQQIALFKLQEIAARKKGPPPQ